MGPYSQPDPAQGVTQPSVAQPGLPQTRIPFAGGLVAMVSGAQLAAEAKAKAEAQQQTPVIQGLASFVRKCWDMAQIAKRQTVEPRLLQCVRQRNGEYDDDVLADIRKQGGTNIYMMITSNKCRAASSWIKDVMLSTRTERPWGLSPTEQPTLPPNAAQQVAKQATQEALEFEQALGQPVVNPQMMEEFVTRVKDRMLADAKTRAAEYTDRMASKMEDQFQEGNFYDALGDFIDDVVTFPFAMMKGPVLRRRKTLKWVQKAAPQQMLPGGGNVVPLRPQGGMDPAAAPNPAVGGPQGMAGAQWVPDVAEEIVPEWERVDPFNVYWAPHCADVDDGYLIERHHLTRDDLQALKGVEGYNDAAITAVLDEHGIGGLRDWLYIDVQKAQVEGKSVSAVMSNPESTIDALQFWGSVMGKHLIDWGVDASEIQDPTAEYPCEVWMIGRWCIKAVLNYDPLGRKPYYKASFEEIPGGWMGNGVADLVRDCQTMCNYAARSLANNMALASGPLMTVNVDRLAAGEDVTQIYPWKITQTTSDPYGNQQQPVTFQVVPTIAQELMAVFNHFTMLADEYSGVPRYMTGDAQGQGALRTSSGISMLMGNAGKAIKQVIGNIDMKVMQPLVDRLYFYNMKYSQDASLKGDVKVVARGVNLLMVKESAQQRRNEFLQIILTSPAVQQIIGPEAIAALLRESAKTLDMDVDKLIPPPEVIRANIMRQQMQAQMQAMQQAQMAGEPDQEVSFERGDDGSVKKAKVMSKNRQTLQNGAPITDHFQPKRNAR